MKFCKFCGKELDDEANFCPYCMNKQISPKVIEPPKAKKSRKKLIIALCCAMGVLLIGASVTGVLLMKPKSASAVSDSAAEQSTKSVDVTAAQTLTENDTTDYTKYIGTWYSADPKTGKASKDMTNGCDMLVIEGVDKNNVRFKFSHIGESPYNRKATIGNVLVALENGIGSFEFTNDGYGNSGVGTIKFEKERIHIETEIKDSNLNALWSIATACYLYSGKELTFDFAQQYNNMLGVNLDTVRDKFGEETKESSENNVEGNGIIHTFGELQVETDSTNNIISYRVNYVDNTSSIYEFDGISSNSTYNDIVDIMGESAIGDEEYAMQGGEIGYGIKGGFIKFIFGDDSTVRSIYAFIPTDDP